MSSLKPTSHRSHPPPARLAASLFFALGTALLALPQAATAGPTFVDAPERLDRPGTLHVVREKTDPATGQTGLLVRYVRPEIGEPVWLTGVLVVDGGVVIDVDASLADLEASDARHATSPELYAPIGARGLELGDDDAAAHGEGDGLRYVAGSRSVAFGFALGARDRSDEIRLRLSVGDRAAEVLLHTHADAVPDVWPPGASDVPIAVGRVDADVVPDDGLYPPGEGIRIRLAHQDLDVPRSVLDLGTVIGGESSATGVFDILDCPADDPDRDDPIDRHGALVVSCSAPLGRIIIELGAPFRAADYGVSLPADAVELVMQVGDGGATTRTGFVTVSPGESATPGRYNGVVRVVGDADGNGRLTHGETFDEVMVELRVEAPEPELTEPPVAEPPPETPSETEPSERYLRGGTCSIGGMNSTESAPPWVLLGLVVLFWLRRRESRRLVASIAFVLTSLTLVSSSQAQTLDASRVHHPGAGSDRMLLTDYGETLDQWEMATTFLATYAHRPLVLVEDGDEVADVIGGRVLGELAIALGVFDGIELGGAIAFVPWQSGDGLEEHAVPSAALGDATLSGRVELFATDDEGIQLASQVAVSMPTGNEDAFATSGGVVVDTGLIFSAGVDPVDFGLNVSTRWRESTELENIDQGHEFHFSGGVKWDMIAGVSAATEFVGSLPLDGEQIDQSHVALEGLLGLGYSPVAQLDLSAGFGLGILPGYGVPAARGLFSTTYRPFAATEGVSEFEAPPESMDSDEDGLLDHEDGCPYEAEDHDGFFDEDGCADLDNDVDGILDVDDGAPNSAEDMDGFDDDDGVPEPDNDLDGLPDGSDACPDEAEDFDGYRDTDGCPDLDNDGDSYPDSADACPDTKGSPLRDGCPLLDDAQDQPGSQDR